jgi:hypothetical protein
LLFTRTPEKKYNIGFDLGERYSQMSYMYPDAEEPRTFSTVPGQEVFNIPTQLTKKMGANLWYCGSEAERHIADGEGTLVTHIFSAALAGRPVSIEGQDYDPCSLLALFVRRCLALLSREVPSDQISCIVFTSARMDRETVEALQKVKGFLNLPVDAVFCESHRNSFYNYMLMSPESMHEHDAMLCEYDGEHAMRVDRLTYNTQTTPVVAYIRSAEYPQLAKAQLPAQKAAPDYVLPDIAADSGTDERDLRFLSILQREAPDNQISSVFFIGEGFKEQWMHQSLRYICYHRKVFLGNNLYSKGAAYGALIRRNPPASASRYFFLGENKLTSNVGVFALRQGRSSYHPVLSAGENWYEAEADEEYILTGGSEITLVISPLTGGQVRQEVIRPENFPSRPEGTARVRAHFSMHTRDELDLTLEDLGFGEIERSTGQVWKFRVKI